MLGCLAVLRPFLAAILFACAVAISSWPLYLALLVRMRGRCTLAGLTMTFSLTLLVILPLAVAAYSLADDVGRFYDQVKLVLERGSFAPPAWLREIPLVGASLLRDWTGSAA